jgi:hypothetical protein
MNRSKIQDELQAKQRRHVSARFGLAKVVLYTLSQIFKNKQLIIIKFTLYGLSNRRL